MIIPIDEQISAVEREIRLRERVYPRFVDSGRMTLAKSEREILAMKAVLATLREVEGKGRLL